MKKLLILLVTATIVLSCSKERITEGTSTSQSSTNASDDSSVTPPQAVLNAFRTQFGNVPVRQWKLRNDGNYRAHFTWNNTPWEATYTAAGTLVKSEAAG